MPKSRFAGRLLSWFDQHGRKDLPWQQTQDPYRIWVSEIMLQQTQVVTVIPYFNRFIKQFPTVQSLAGASQDEVLALWSGLGYYARARNMHHAAKEIVGNYSGKFPKTRDEVLALPGIGRSTAHAILAFSSGQKLPILDGNVKRVLSRVFGIEEPVDNKQVEAKLWQLADELMPATRIAEYTQAIMDLGATICLRSKPLCPQCPMQDFCFAHLHHKTASIPKKAKKLASKVKSTYFLMVATRDEVLLFKQKERGIWGGLQSFISFDTLPELKIWLKENAIKSDTLLSWPKRKHVFTHFTLYFTPVVVTIKKKKIVGATWHPLNNLDKLALPKPIRQLLTDFYEMHHGQNDLLSEIKN